MSSSKSTDTSAPLQPPVQGPDRISRLARLALLLIVGALLAAGALVWRFYEYLPLGCYQAADTTRSGAVTEFCFPYSVEPTNGTITVGPDGNLWFAESVRNKIARITPKGTITEFAVPSVPSPAPGRPTLDRLDPSIDAYFRIVRGPDGNLWYTGDGTLGRMSPHGDVREFALPKGSGFITGLTAGPDSNIWFGLSTGQIAKMSVDGKITEFSVAGARVGELAAGPDGNIWFGLDNVTSSVIGRITPAGVITMFPFETPYYINELTAGPDGNVWFSTAAGSERANSGYMSTTDSIGRITPNGSIKLIPIPGLPATPEPGKPYLEGSIAAGPDGNIWFGMNPGMIGRLTLAGKVTLIQLPHSGLGAANSMTAGPDGGLWYTFAMEFPLFGSIWGTRVGRITP